MKDIRTALADAGFTVNHVTDTEIRYVNASGYTISLIHHNPTTLELLQVENIKAFGPGTTTIDFRALQPTDPLQTISIISLMRNNELKLTSKPLNIRRLTLRYGIVDNMTTTERTIGHLSVIDSTLERVSIIGSSTPHPTIFLEESDLCDVSLDPKAMMNFHRVACYGDHYILPDAPAGTTTNLAGQRICYSAHLNHKGQTYLILGCWSGTLTEAQALIEKKAHKWPSYKAANGDVDVKAARKRYRKLFAHIQETMETVTTIRTLSDQLSKKD